jgi:two-component system cell cycle sensor histidine kinase/response regulator CckA
MKKILVVDNSKIILEFMKDMLSKEGYEVLTAEDGLSALDILRTFIPDVIFIDLVMPNIRGEKLCRIVRDMPAMSETYLVILSAIAAEEEVDFYRFGADACIAKGQFRKMGQHVLAVLKQLELGKKLDLAEKVIGREEIYKRDITEELLASRGHFEAILGNMSEGILELTLEGKIVYANPVAIALADTPEEKLLASQFTELFHENHRNKVKDLLNAVVETPRPITDDSPVRLNGKHVSLSILPVRNQENSIIVILNDVTEKKRMEAKLREIQKMEALGTLAGGIAHDFNNLLMGILGNASLLLLDEDCGDPRYERLKSIEQYVQSGSDLTRQLLGFARGGKYQVKPSNLNDLLKKSSEMFGRTKKEIAIHSKYQENIWTVEVDEGQIEQTLLNLYVNAWQAMPGGGEIYLETQNVVLDRSYVEPYDLEPGNYVKLSVTDTGIGMDEETQQRIFDPFFTTKEMGRGTGLGLASAYGIIRNHGGILSVYSEKGEGTTFEIYLPACEKQAVKEKRFDEDVLEGTETILLVDDEDMIIDVGKQMLSRLGYKVLAARSGREAIEIISKTHKLGSSPDLVILDMIMPDMCGGETFDRIKAINPDIKVLLSSGYSINSKARGILERGCDGFIQKPFNIKQLSQRSREILDKE